MSMRGLYIPGDAPWRKDFEAELRRFPARVHDDMVDSLALMGQLLDRALPGLAPKAPPKPSGGMSDYKTMRTGGGS